MLFDCVHINKKIYINLTSTEFIVIHTTAKLFNKKTKTKSNLEINTYAINF